MTNVLGNYNPIFYAQKALDYLHNSMGMARTVFMGLDEEYKSRQQGDTITVKRPSRFTVQDAPSSAQDLAVETVTMTLAYWREVKFKLTDKEVAIATERIIREHVAPAAIELANDIDTKLALLANYVPWFTDLTSTPVASDLTAARKVLFDNKVPLADQANMFGMVDGNLEAALLNLTAFTQNQGSGDIGTAAQINGAVGKRYGINWFANQNVQSHVKGTASTGTLALVGAHSKFGTTVTLDAVSVTGTLTAGDSFVLAGNSQRYTVLATVTASGNAFPAVAISPPLVQDYADNTVATVSLDDHVMNMAYHRNAFGLVMAKLPDELLRGLGMQVASIMDPVTGLSIRAAIYAVPNSSEVHCKLDVLYGVVALNPNLAMRMRG